MGIVLGYGEMRRSGDGPWRWLYDNVNPLNATELSSENVLYGRF